MDAMIALFLKLFNLMNLINKTCLVEWTTGTHPQQFCCNTVNGGDYVSTMLRTPKQVLTLRYERAGFGTGTYYVNNMSMLGMSDEQKVMTIAMVRAFAQMVHAEANKQLRSMEANNWCSQQQEYWENSIWDVRRAGAHAEEFMGWNPMPYLTR